MKGLLIKDFQLMKVQKNFFLMLLLLSIGMEVFLDGSDFIIAYLTFICSLFTVSTINYDEFDNGNAFLFSLPISRTDYTVEKYLLGLIIGGVTLLFSTALAGLAGVIKHDMPLMDTLTTAFTMLPALLLLLAVMLPFQFKFGGDKGRIAIIIAVGAACALGALLVKLMNTLSIDLTSVLEHLPTVSIGILLAAVFAIAVMIFLISIKISIRILNKKEF